MVRVDTARSEAMEVDEPVQVEVPKVEVDQVAMEVEQPGEIGCGVLCVLGC
jgi:hypothetical protein